MVTFLKIILLLLLFLFLQARLHEFFDRHSKGSRISGMGKELKRLFSAQRLPLHRYLGVHTKAQIKCGGSEVTLMNCFYSPELGTYMYWVTSKDGSATVVPERFISQGEIPCPTQKQ